MMTRLSPASKFERFPMVMTHPDMTEDNRDRFPTVTVRSAEEEEQWCSRGYKPAGKSDPDAFHRASAVADPDHKPIEFPKLVRGVVVESKAEEDAILNGGDYLAVRRAAEALARPSAIVAFPKMIGDVVVNDAEEEAAVRRGVSIVDFRRTKAGKANRAEEKAKAEAAQWPQWVGDKIAHNPEERAAILEARARRKA